MSTLELRYQVPADVAARNIAGEVVVVTPADSKVHELDAVGSVMFEACDGRRTVREVAELVTRSFEVEPGVAEHDTAEFLARLASVRSRERSPPHDPHHG